MDLPAKKGTIMQKRKIRIGIDVGGTFTHAVALDHQSYQVIAHAVTPTTHSSQYSVSEGIIKTFQDVLQQTGAAPEDVVFVAHSTTQATNALLEGDVAKVGIIGMANGGIEGWLSKKQSNIPDIDLGTGRFIRTCHTFIKLKDVNEQTVEAAIQKLQAEGAQVIVASKAFGVDSIKEELLVRDIAEKHGLLVSVASDISKLPCVREKMVSLQRELAGRQSCVLDGRDICLHVLPEARYKFFLTASASERARRRCAELAQRGKKVNFETVLADINDRDYNDMHRALSPLAQAPDAVLVDSTALTLEQVLDYMLSFIEEQADVL